ncbi:hypothetical protein N8I74_10945 [Chitiniphilus purpureus]|uniref:Uncharacterized protein n=1 Tax=Chitiniphilus purpureus TaxID=2981137 RepID=A0ABY6DHL9_9NEIS|nr:hypothetical protein [Chitiniphilus sp. CD1]UXY13839.1 hypothetical protein N8I74_10945 [Chitiniphilus sp. CD1]
MAFAISLGATVQITASGETGIVIGRAEYLHSEPNYFVRYCGADGRAIESWWGESALQESPTVI